MTLQALISKANFEIENSKLVIKQNLDQIEEQIKNCNAEINRQNEIIQYWQDLINGISDNM